MANQEQVERLRQGLDSWSDWISENSSRPVTIDLSGADLSGADLMLFHLVGADLSGADLSGADLYKANLYSANLHKANLYKANLYVTDLYEADLSQAELSQATLERANLSGANLSGANLSGAILEGTTLAKIDLRTTKGLSAIQYQGPSDIELSSVLLPQDGSALHFLRGVGVPDEWIDDYLARMMHPIQYYSCFISYSSKDEAAAKRLHADLQAESVRCWFAPEDLKIGDRFHQRIHEAIHVQDKLLLLLSEHAIASEWVEIEVRAALEKEHRQHRDVLFPVRLDESVMDTDQAWAAMLRQSRHIGDFSQWENAQVYQAAFARLLQDLKQ